MFLRYYEKDKLDLISAKGYLTSLPKYSKVLDEKADSTGYVPVYTVVYIRSTANDVVTSESNTEAFYKVFKSQLPNDSVTVFDESLLLARQGLESVVTADEFSSPDLPFKSFPKSGGCFVGSDYSSEREGVYLIMSVIVDKEYFDNMRLKEGFVKKPFVLYNSADEFTKRVAQSFIHVQTPKKGV